MNGTSKASSVVRAFRAKPLCNLFYIQLSDEEHVCTLDFPNPSYTIRVYFSKIKHMPHAMRIRSTNWRCEDEPNGVFSIEESRQFYQDLIAHGFLTF